MGNEFAISGANQEARQKSKEFYLGEMAVASQGPLIEGFSPIDLEQVLSDPRTSMIDLVNADGTTVAWPLLTPITNFSEYMPSYFENRYGSAENVFYLALPPEAGSSMKLVGKSILDSVSRNPEILFVYDEIDGQNKYQIISETVQIVEPTLEPVQELFLDPKNNTPASSIHFGGVAVTNKDVPNPSKSMAESYDNLISSGEIEVEGDNRTVLLDPTKLNDKLDLYEDKTVLSRLWDIYEAQFNRLVENHPARGSQTFEEFKTMVEDPNTYTIAHFSENDIAAFAVFVSDINACEWLNADFYRETFHDEPILYFPGIASDINKRGEIYSLHIVKLLSLLEHQMQQDPAILFQCTNISADYIPYKIVEPAGNSTGIIKISISEMMRYNYRGFKVSKTN